MGFAWTPLAWLVRKVPLPLKYYSVSKIGGRPVRVPWCLSALKSPGISAMFAFFLITMKLPQWGWGGSPQKLRNWPLSLLTLCYQWLPPRISESWQLNGHWKKNHWNWSLKIEIQVFALFLIGHVPLHKSLSFAGLQFPCLIVSDAMWTTLCNKKLRWWHCAY